MYRAIMNFVRRTMKTPENLTTQIWEENRWIATLEIGAPGFPPVRRVFWLSAKPLPGFHQPEGTTPGDVLESENIHYPDIRLYWVVIRSTQDETEVKLCKSFLSAMIESEKITGCL